MHIRNNTFKTYSCLYSNICMKCIDVRVDVKRNRNQHKKRQHLYFVYNNVTRSCTIIIIVSTYWQKSCACTSIKYEYAGMLYVGLCMWSFPYIYIYHIHHKKICITIAQKREIIHFALLVAQTATVYILHMKCDIKYQSTIQKYIIKEMCRAYLS